MNKLWMLLQEVIESKSSYRSMMHDMVSEGRLDVTIDTVKEKIYYLEEGENTLNFKDRFVVKNNVLWKREKNHITYSRKRLNGYEKLFDIFYDEKNKRYSASLPHT